MSNPKPTYRIVRHPRVPHPIYSRPQPSVPMFAPDGTMRMVYPEQVREFILLGYVDERTHQAELAEIAQTGVVVAKTSDELIADAHPTKIQPKINAKKPSKKPVKKAAKKAVPEKIPEITEPLPCIVPQENV